jgi:hypothetical protein
MPSATRVAILVLIAPATACGHDAPTGPEEPGAGPPAIASKAAPAATRVAVDDLLDRVAPALGGDAAMLTAALARLAAALGEGGEDRVTRALRAANHSLVDLAPTLGEEHRADLVAVRLVLEHVRTSLRSPIGG